jgi:hypothetical protein
MCGWDSIFPVVVVKIRFLVSHKRLKLAHDIVNTKGITVHCWSTITF